MGRFDKVDAVSRFAIAKPEPKPKPVRAKDPVKAIEEGINVIQVEVDAETAAIHAKIREERRKEKKRFIDNTDSEYHVTFCFQSREQKDEFLAKTGLVEIGDKYLDGMKVAKIMGIKLESEVPKMPNPKNDKSWGKYVE